MSNKKNTPEKGTKGKDKEPAKDHKEPINHATHKVTKQDVKNNPGEGLKVGEKVEIPFESPDLSLSKKDPKNAAGESKVHVESMKEEQGTEERPEEGKALNAAGPNLPTNIGEEPTTSTEESEQDKMKSAEEMDVSAKEAELPQVQEGPGWENRYYQGIDPYPTDNGDTDKYEKNAAGESKTHQESMKHNHGSETRPERTTEGEEQGYKSEEQGFKSEEQGFDDNLYAKSPGTHTEGSTVPNPQVLQDKKNAAGESTVKADAERNSEKPH